MRPIPVFLALLSIGIYVSANAQSGGVELRAGLGYARAFDGGGVSFAAAVDRPFSLQTSKLQHALGGGLWYARTDVPSNPDARDLLGISLRYRLELGPTSRSARLFLALPVEVLLSHIPDRPALQGTPATAALFGVPEPGGSFPAENHVGSEWGWGTGLELGLRGRLGQQLSAYTSVLGLYQDIYGAGTRGTLWNWHAGITYELGGR